MQQRVLPGFHPGYIRIDLTDTATEGWSVRIWACDGPGFVHARDSEDYHNLTLREAHDVVEATLATFGA